jgi:DNA-binding SARP family transcriptional activator
VLATLVAAMMLDGDYATAFSMVGDFSRFAQTPLMRDVAAATRAVAESSIDGDVSAALQLCEALAEKCRSEQLFHYEGISWLNAAHLARAAGRVEMALGLTRLAVDALTAGAGGPELASARFLEATLIGVQGDLLDARARFRRLEQDLVGIPRNECLTELAEMELLVGDAELGQQALGRLDETLIPIHVELVDFVRAISALRAADCSGAAALLRAIPTQRPSAYPAYKTSVHAMEAVALALSGDATATAAAALAAASARGQGARPWSVVAQLAAHSGSTSMSSALVTVPAELQFAISIGAELVAANLDRLDEAAIELVRSIAGRYKERWRAVLRQHARANGASALSAARILDEIGEPSDIPLLRAIARVPKRTAGDRQLGRGLARRLAPRAVIHDLGRVSIDVGKLDVGSHQVRRKVLALLCFLLTRPRWAATREEVMEAMWPDIDPSSAINSLNQSVYFLRRVFEPDYTEDTTAGYVHQDSDLLWIDPELIGSDSRVCAALIESYERQTDPDLALELAERYTGRFALDFAYDDWSTDYREWLHVAWLHVLETQIRLDIDAGRFDRGIRVARRALEIEPRNDELELSMLKLLRRAGAHSAAAEQYSRYSNVLRTDIGVEPPSLESV